MAKATITFEDGNIEGEIGIKILASFEPAEYENATPAQGLCFSVKGLIDSGQLPLGQFFRAGIADMKEMADALRAQDAKQADGSLEPVVIGSKDPFAQLAEALGLDRDAIVNGDSDEDDDDDDDEDDDYYEDEEDLDDDDPEDDRVVQD